MRQIFLDCSKQWRVYSHRGIPLCKEPPSVKVSIVTPSFRQLEWLKLCAASIADQKCVEFEHIIQDAGTGPKAEDWIKQNTSARLFVEKDAGMYDAINRGFDRATGDILAWLNCDEQYLPGTLEKVAQFFETHPQVEMLFADAVLISQEGTPLSYRRMVRPHWLHIRLAHLNTLSCATFFRRSVLHERGLRFRTEWKAIGDAVWMCEIVKTGVRLAVLQEPLSVFTFTKVNLGASDVARAEARRWRSLPDTPPLWLKKPIVFWHRLRKLAAGSYAPKSIDIEIYTRDSPHQRIRKHLKRAPFGWPSSK